MKHIITITAIGFCLSVSAQKAAIFDTLKSVSIEIQSASNLQMVNYGNSSASLEDQIQKSTSFNLVERGGYAQEIIFRGLSSFQTNTKLDGMRVFAACTDKMDPITAYVDRDNLKSLNTKAQVSGCMHGLDLEINKPDLYGKTKLNGSILTQYKSNQNAFKTSLNLQQSKGRFWYKWNINYQDANNYKAGNNKEIKFTQFTKFNTLLSAGYKVKNHAFEIMGIKDLATNIGYAALPMDVSVANASIFKASHKTNIGKTKVSNQVYYNNIYHEMDDSKRPSNPITMDMPGWSETFGFSGNAKRLFEKSLVNIQYELVKNLRKAEMTMYISDAPAMYMQTWPKTNRILASISPSFNYYLSDKLSSGIHSSFSIAKDNLSEVFGRNQWSVFDYDLTSIKSRFAWSVDGFVEYVQKAFTNRTSLKIGERLPDISELYGFYLFNAQDGFDYLGKPDLNNEQYYTLTNDFSVKTNLLQIGWNNYFYWFNNYIFGLQQAGFSTMTVGANGIKQYENIGQAYILGTEVSIKSIEFIIPTEITLAYRYGESNKIGYLPQMLPWQVALNNNYQIKKHSFCLKNNYTSSYYRASKAFGEKNAKSFLLTDVCYSTNFKLGENKLKVEVGATNLFNQHYTSHFSWGAIPLMGRSVNTSLVFRF